MEQAKRPEEVVNHCLVAREYRVGIDFVQDNVVSALKAEMGEIQRIRAAMKQHHDDIESQLLTNDNIATRLRVDLSQKRTALDIDQDCFILDNSSHEINHHPGIHHADLANSNPQSWIKHSDQNMEDSNNARKASSALKGNVEGLMSSACTELSTAWSITNRSFKERIMETEETSGLISKHLDNIVQDMMQALKEVVHCCTGWSITVPLLIVESDFYSLLFTRRQLWHRRAPAGRTIRETPAKLL